MTITAEELGRTICERLGIDPGTTCKVSFLSEAHGSRPAGMAVTPGFAQVIVTRYWSDAIAEKFLADNSVVHGEMNLQIFVPTEDTTDEESLSP